MRKYVIGIVIGFSLSFAVGAHAEVKNLVGRVIEGSFPVKFNGEDLTETALIVDGTSYLPVRALSETLGLDVKFDADLGISLTEVKGERIEEKMPRRQTVFPENPSPPSTPLSIIEDKLESAKSKKQSYEMWAKVAEENMRVTKDKFPEMYDEVKAELAKYQAELIKIEAELDELEREKAELLNQK